MGYLSACASPKPAQLPHELSGAAFSGGDRQPDHPSQAADVDAPFVRSIPNPRAMQISCWSCGTSIA